MGFPELMIILIIALIVFGPRRLPELGKALGQTINEFKKGANSLRESVEAEIQREEQQKQIIPAPVVTSVPGTEPRNG